MLTTPSMAEESGEPIPNCIGRRGCYGWEGERFQLAKPSLTPQLISIKRTAEDRELEIEDDGEKNEEMNERFRSASCSCDDGEDVGVLCEVMLPVKWAASNSTLDPTGVR